MQAITVQQALASALAHHRSGRLAEAEAIYRLILSQQPDQPDALQFLGVIALQTGQSEAALQLLQRAVVVAPGAAAVHAKLGDVYRKLGQLEEAIAALRRAIELQPGWGDVYNSLGLALREAGAIEEAIAAYRRALAIEPDNAGTLNNLAVALSVHGNLEEAIATCRAALRIQPRNGTLSSNLANVLIVAGRLDEAIATCREALQWEPDSTAMHDHLARALREQGSIDEALAHYRRAEELTPGSALLRSNVIYAAHFHPGFDRATLERECALWEERHGAPLRAGLAAHRNQADAARRIRVGYVSPDFRDHVIGRNLLPLFEQHEHKTFEIICYSDVVKPDAITARFQMLADRWRDTIGMNDAALATAIRADEVDILVDLTQHMAGNRLPVFAQQPAPVQFSFAGYPGATGLKAIGHRISDRFLEPHPRESGERLWLIDSFWCYDPREEALDAGPSPAQQDGIVTFGCLNSFCKVTQPMLDRWRQVLGEVPGSRLKLLCPEGSHRDRVAAVLGKERVEFVVPRPRREYLELYRGIDVALDTFPYNGHTTSLDALWMGVPVVTLAGETAVSRGGLSVLGNLGFGEWVAHSEEEYVRKAIDAAADLSRLAQWRTELRGRMKASVLMDAPRFARQIETIYRAAWREWCANALETR